MANPSGAFRVSLPGVEAGEGVLGVWQARRAPPPTLRQPARAFGALGGAATRAGPLDEAPATLWEVDLPRDPRQAGSLLAAQELRLAQAEQALPQAGQRLERYIEVRQRSAGSFALDRRSGPEARLDAWLGLGGAATYGAAPFGTANFSAAMYGAVIHGAIPGLPEDWEAAVGQAKALLENLGQAAAYAAWVETSSSGKLVGRTTVAWDGDLRHFWLQGAAAGQAGQHQRSLDLALRSRLAWVKMILLVLSGGLKLAVLSAAGPVAAIPAAFQFFRQIIAQAQEIQALQPDISPEAA